MSSTNSAVSAQQQQQQQQRIVINTNIHGPSILRVGGIINRYNRRRRNRKQKLLLNANNNSQLFAASTTKMETLDTLDVMGGDSVEDAWSNVELSLGELRQASVFVVLFCFV